MLVRQFSQFKNQLSSPNQTDRPNTQDDLNSLYRTQSTNLSQPQQMNVEIFPSQSQIANTKKIGLFEMINGSKKNSIKSNLSTGNNLSSQGFRASQTTYYTDRNAIDDIPTHHLKNNSSINNLSSLKRVKTERISSLQNRVKANKNLKFQHMKIHEQIPIKRKIPKQPSITSIVSPLQQNQVLSPLIHQKNKSLTDRNPSLNTCQSQQKGSSQQLVYTVPSQTNQQSLVSISSPQPKPHLKMAMQHVLSLSKQNSNASSNPSPSKMTSPPMIQRIISELQTKKTPFTTICKQIYTNMQYVQRKIKSKVQLFNHFSKVLSNKSHYLQNIFLIPEIQEVVQDPAIIDKALVQIINSAEFRSSTHAQRGLIKSLILELSIFNKEIFEVYLAQSKQEIVNIREKIQYEREEVDLLSVKLTAKHYPNFQKKATLFNILSHHNMPVTYNKEKYDLMEEKLGKFNFISQENRFVCSEIEKVICNLKEINYNNNNPYRNTFW